MAHINEVIPDPAKRKPIYQVFAAIGLLIGAAQVAFASIPDAGQPTWLTVSLSVYAFLGAAGFAVAQSNTDTTTPEIEEASYIPLHAE